MSKILIIEDEESVRENLLDLLEAEGYEVVSAPNGRVGVDVAIQELPDLIICDIMMPVMDGFQVLEELRTEPVTAIIPFLFLTAKAAPEDLRTGMGMGADDYLTKPFLREDVLRAIETRLARQTQVAQRYESKMNELRRSMALMLPHELRTPLAVILGYSTYLKDTCDTLGVGDIREIGDIIYRTGERLYRLIEKFLLYAELELIARSPEHVQTLRRSHVDAIAPLCQKIARQKATDAKREADLVLVLQDAAAQIDGVYLSFILEELIENAFKFSPPGTLVQVSSASAGNTLYFTISDQGFGMTPEQVADINAYTQFQRQGFEHPGQGLGLTIARRLAELHGGELNIESIPGQGTMVHVILPLA